MENHILQSMIGKKHTQFNYIVVVVVVVAFDADKLTSVNAKSSFFDVSVISISLIFFESPIRNGSLIRLAIRVRSFSEYINQSIDK